eukprot:TRINITY_DN3554_c0_g3_i1.p1 TRINITY_DN3554_c0_g3~~TRINITY_DN3554_c0_g3_i1.p1  ORF type:complete len:546 (-),score=115.91 TRINITY_DN3554_c0_g3_i1:80-1717(-)
MMMGEKPFSGDLLVAMNDNNYDLIGTLLYAGIPYHDACGSGRIPVPSSSSSTQSNTLTMECVPVDMRDTKFNTPLCYAAFLGDMEIVDHLIRSGADVNLSGYRSRTPFWYAAWKGHMQVARTLAHVSADVVNTADGDGTTPLHNAVGENNMAMVRFLLEVGADINAKSHLGYTPLHTAALSGYKDIMHVLTESGADVDILTAYDAKTAAQLASSFSPISTQDIKSTKKVRRASIIDLPFPSSSPSSSPPLDTALLLDAIQSPHHSHADPDASYPYIAPVIIICFLLVGIFLLVVMGPFRRRQQVAKKGTHRRPLAISNATLFSRLFASLSNLSFTSTASSLILSSSSSIARTSLSSLPTRRANKTDEKKKKKKSHKKATSTRVHHPNEEVESDDVILPSVVPDPSSSSSESKPSSLPPLPPAMIASSSDSTTTSEEDEEVAITENDDVIYHHAAAATANPTIIATTTTITEPSTAATWAGTGVAGGGPPPDDSMCAICLDRPRNTVLLPCRHLCSCYACAQELQASFGKCVLCRASVDSVMCVYV